VTGGGGRATRLEGRSQRVECLDVGATVDGDGERAWQGGEEWAPEAQFGDREGGAMSSTQD
jgi:hypothetical protein